MELPEFAIEAEGLVKEYPAGKGTSAKLALNGIDLKVPRGSIFGLLGPNGAGKSTFINILAGLTKKTRGTVRLWGRDIDQRPRDARLKIEWSPRQINCRTSLIRSHPPPRPLQPPKSNARQP